MPDVEQYAATVALVEQWNIRTLVVDATGLGSPLASLLLTRLGEQRVRPYTFTRPSKSHLAYELLALLNSGRLKLYAREGAPAPIVSQRRSVLMLIAHTALMPIHHARHTHHIYATNNI